MMICQTCFGWDARNKKYCPDCQGSERTHCCEGDCEQPPWSQNPFRTPEETATKEALDELAKKYKPPQEWYEEYLEDLF